MTVKPRYSVLIRAMSDEDGGGWIAIVPDLPGCVSDGKTQMEALKNVEDAIETWVSTAKKHNHPIPREDEFIARVFNIDLPEHVKRQARRMAQQWQGLDISEEPDPDVLHAVYSQIARSTIEMRQGSSFEKQNDCSWRISTVVHSGQQKNFTVPCVFWLTSISEKQHNSFNYCQI